MVKWYETKPVINVVRAIQWTGDNIDEVRTFVEELEGWSVEVANRPSDSIWITDPHEWSIMCRKNDYIVFEDKEYIVYSENQFHEVYIESDDSNHIF